MVLGMWRVHLSACPAALPEGFLRGSSRHRHCGPRRALYARAGGPDQTGWTRCTPPSTITTRRRARWRWACPADTVAGATGRRFHRWYAKLTAAPSKASLAVAKVAGSGDHITQAPGEADHPRTAWCRAGDPLAEVMGLPPPGSRRRRRQNPHRRDRLDAPGWPDSRQRPRRRWRLPRQAVSADAGHRCFLPDGDTRAGMIPRLRSAGPSRLTA